jgi:hypothetical protein
LAFLQKNSAKTKGRSKEGNKMYGLDYSPEIEQSIIQVELQDITKDVISILFPPIPKGDNIQFRSSQVYGIMGTGKTSLYRSMGFFAWLKYFSDLKNVNLIIHESLDVLMANIDSKPVQVLFVDDAGLENQDAAKKLISKFTRIRHIFEEKRKNIGKKNGVIVVFFAVQDIYLITKKLRSTVHVDIYKNAPTNDHDKNKLAKKIGLVAIKKLDDISDQVFKKHNYEALSECVASTICGDTGFITCDFISSDDSIITEIEAEAEPINNFKITKGDYELYEIDEFINTELIIRALVNWEFIKEKIGLETKLLQQRHIDAFKKYLEGYGLESIGDELGVSGAAIGNNYENRGWLAIVREEILGHLIEYQLTQPGEYYEFYTRIAGTGRIDLLSPDKSKAIEVKSRWQKETITGDMFSTEMKKLLEEGFPCELCSCVTRYNKAFFKIYQILKKPKQLYEPSSPSLEQKLSEKEPSAVDDPTKSSRRKGKEKGKGKTSKGTKSKTKSRKKGVIKPKKEVEGRQYLIPALEKMKADPNFNKLTQKEKYSMHERLMKEMAEEKEDVSNDY